MNISNDLPYHWLWQDKPFPKLQAWVDLLYLAEKESKYFRGKVYRLKKGQLVTSETTLCDRWGWSRTKVRSFLHSLSEDSMLSMDVNKGKTIITITKYPNKTSKNTTVGQEEIQEKRQDEIQDKCSDNECDNSCKLSSKKQVNIQAESKIKEHHKTVQKPNFVQLSLIDAIEEKDNEK